MESQRKNNPGGLFKGWHVVGTLFLGGFMLYGAGVYAFILFVPPLAQEFQWSSASTGGLVSAFWISAPLTLWAAPLISRFGDRRLAITGIVIEGVALVFLFLATGLWQMYLLRAIAGLGKVLFAITLPIILAKWFSRRFGLAAAIMYSGWHLGGLGLAPLTELLLSSFGWRATSVALGIALLAIAVPVTFRGLGHGSAAEAGLQVDGGSFYGATDVTPAAEVDATDPPLSHSALLCELLASPVFRLIMAATPLYYLTYGGVLLQQAAVVQGSGATAYAASWVVGLTAGSAALGAILGGWVSDRYSPSVSGLATFSLLGGGIGCLLVATFNPSFTLLTLHGLIFGLGIGSGDIFWIALLRRLIPGRLFPSAWGVWYFLQLVFLIAAPVVAGTIFDSTGSYPVMLVAQLAILLIALTLVLALTRRPRRSVGALPQPSDRLGQMCGRR